MPIKYAALRFVIPMLLLATVTDVFAAQVFISPDIPNGVTKDFMQRVQSKSLQKAIKAAGRLVTVKSGIHVLKVPCDGIADGKYATVTLKLDDLSIKKIRFISCGINIYESSVKIGVR